MESGSSSSQEKANTSLRGSKNGLHPVYQIFIKSLIYLSINKFDISNSCSTSCFDGAHSQQMNVPISISEMAVLSYDVS